jgi:hypothetical protein
MPTPKPKKVGRPMLPKGEAKGKIVAMRFNADDLKRVEIAAKVAKQTVSEWIRTAVSTALLQTLAVVNLEKGSDSKESRKIRRELRDHLEHRGGLRGEG